MEALSNTMIWLVLHKAWDWISNIKPFDIRLIFWGDGSSRDISFGLFYKNHQIWSSNIKPFDIHLISIFTKWPPRILRFGLFYKIMRWISIIKPSIFWGDGASRDFSFALFYNICISNIKTFDIHLIFAKCPPQKTIIWLFFLNHEIWISNIKPFDNRLIFAKCARLELEVFWPGSDR